jgi:hypothetical protein
MPRQVVGSERGKANPVKRLRAHTSTLAARTESDKGKSPGAPTLDSEMGASREGANRGPRGQVFVRGVENRGPRVDHHPPAPA